jgi:hypothetical protein
LLYQMMDTISLHLCRLRTVPCNVVDAPHHIRQYNTNEAEVSDVHVLPPGRSSFMGFFSATTIIL